MVPIEFDVIVLKEGETFVAYCPELDVSSCGESIDHAREMLKTAVRLFIEESEKMGTLEDILAEAYYTQDAGGKWLPPELASVGSVSIS